VTDVAFWALAVLLLAGAVAVVSARSLFRATFALAATLLVTAAFYLLLEAPLLAAVQVLLYTGGVLTLTVFALVVAGDQTDAARWRRPAPAAFLSVAVFVVLAVPIVRTIRASAAGERVPTPPVGEALFGVYLVPFELLSVLLLAAVFGALLLARKDRPE
jgi:NADH:ubiquinone oxidoreductase subunit 6 (subunit J)